MKEKRKKNYLTHIIPRILTRRLREIIPHIISLRTRPMKSLLLLLLSGYRPKPNSVKEAFLSAFQINNEFFNIWSQSCPETSEFCGIPNFLMS